ncbi:hypothetical protein GYMLUDRAFT_550466 [Collybiopsis luxurians FD-317 M1]|nr:hypothetical protein GYMLUDRAFT_550466 [Collybiopsis luxurians FD-317 M1]
MRLDGDSEDRAGFELDDSIRENCLVEVIYLRPGDFIFQPPGVMYLVYTPAATAAWGSHSYSYHTMHLTEWTRKVQHFLSDNTDQEPTPVRQNLYAMMINLPNFANEVFYTRSIAALCKMVLHENDYLASRQPRCEGNEFERVAKNVAMVVARLCLGASTPNTMNLPPKMRLAVERLAIVQHLDQILTEGNYDDPGKSFTLEEQVLLAVEELEESDKLTL